MTLMAMGACILRLCYFSAWRLSEDSDVACLAEQSRLHNARAGITGIMLHDAGAFSQVLEGEPDAVRALFAKIERDRRHNYVTELYRTESGERLFTPWPMAFLGRQEFSNAHRWPNKEMIAALKTAYGEAGDSAGRQLLASFFSSAPAAYSRL